MVLAFSSCMKEDDELQRQVAGLNEQLKAKTAELDAKSKALEQAQTAAKPATPPVSGEELTNARTQINELQQQLASLHVLLVQQRDPLASGLRVVQSNQRFAAELRTNQLQKKRGQLQQQEHRPSNYCVYTRLCVSTLLHVS